MGKQFPFWSWFITNRLQNLGLSKIDQVISEVSAEQERQRRKIKNMMTDFKREVAYDRQRTFGSHLQVQR